MEAEIKKIVEVGGVSEDMASFVANGYANTINEDDLFTNPEGVLSINKKDFLKDVVDDDLDTAQKERFEFIVNKILRCLPKYVPKVPRRMSLSIKRPNEGSSDVENKEEKKQKGESTKNITKKEGDREKAEDKI